MPPNALHPRERAPTTRPAMTTEDVKAERDAGYRVDTTMHILYSFISGMASQKGRGMTTLSHTDDLMNIIKYIFVCVEVFIMC